MHFTFNLCAFSLITSFILLTHVALQNNRSYNALQQDVEGLEHSFTHYLFLHSRS